MQRKFFICIVIISSMYYTNTFSWVHDRLNENNQNNFTQNYLPELNQEIADEINRLIQEKEEISKKKNAEMCVTKKNVVLDEVLMQQLITQCPETLRNIIEALIDRNQFDDDLYHGFIPHHIVLVGPPGVGKSSLARVIAQVCKIPYTFIKSIIIANEYINSGPNNLQRLFEPILAQNEPHIIILDELQTIVKKKDHDDFDMTTAEALWMLLDECKLRNNILIIATANDISHLPDQLKSRLAKSVYEIRLPDFNARKRIFLYYMGKNKMVNVNISNKNINRLIKITKDFSCRDLEDMISVGISRAFLRSRKRHDKSIILLESDLQAGFVHIKDQKNNSNAIKTWCRKIIKILGPAVSVSLCVSALQILLQCYFYYDHKRYASLYYKK